MIEPPPAAMDDTLVFNGEAWDAKSNPVHIPGAPKFVDGWFNNKVGRAQHNIARIKADPSQYTEAFIGAIPTALFVLDRLIAAGLPDRTLLTAMGPGFTASCVGLRRPK